MFFSESGQKHIYARERQLCCYILNVDEEYNAV